MSDSEFEFSAAMELSSDIYNEEFSETKCDYCNSALHDCSLCGVVGFGEYDDTPIC